MIWSDHGTNFVGDLREISNFLDQQRVQGLVSEFCSSRHIVWKFIPERSPHFGGLWEAAVKRPLEESHNQRQVDIRRNDDSTNQIEACLNSRPLAPLTSNTEGIDILTPGHFALPDPVFLSIVHIVETLGSLSATSSPLLAALVL